VFYSVAEHSVRVSEHLKKCALEQLHGLLHDAAEAYLIDLPSPIKYTLGGRYLEAEIRLQEMIYDVFGLPFMSPKAHKNMKQADQILLATESRDLMPNRQGNWALSAEEPLEERIVPWSAEQAEQSFLARFYELRG